MAKLNVYFYIPELSCQNSQQLQSASANSPVNFECSFDRKVEHCQSKLNLILKNQNCPAKRVNGCGSAPAN